jgi:hypothetical protein
MKAGCLAEEREHADRPKWAGAICAAVTQYTTTSLSFVFLPCEYLSWYLAKIEWRHRHRVGPVFHLL